MVSDDDDGDGDDDAAAAGVASVSGQRILCGQQRPEFLRSTEMWLGLTEVKGLPLILLLLHGPPRPSSSRCCCACLLKN